MKTLIYFLIAFLPISLSAQTSISGLVTDKSGMAIIGANVVLEGSYDGSSTDLDGKFQFRTKKLGAQNLLISYLGYVTYQETIQLNGSAVELNVVLKEDMKMLETVQITAGAFEASEEKKSVVLKPLDIVTTAGATADISGALNTLPGTQVVADEGQLFVRGGEARETQTFIDGLLVPKPFNSAVPDIPARGRFSPFLFKGVVFSTGGYSAEYGQALSSALILKTEGLAPKTVTNLSLMVVGTALNHTQRWENASLSIGGEYINLKPLFAMLRPNTDWVEEPNGFGGQMIYRHKVGKDGLFKMMGQYSRNNLVLNERRIDFGPEPSRFDLANDNYYLNTEYTDLLKNDWSFKAGVSVSKDIEEFGIGLASLHIQDLTIQTRMRAGKFVTNNLHLKFGAELNTQRNEIEKGFAEFEVAPLSFNRFLYSSFAEGDLYFSKKLVARVGLRAEYDQLIGKPNLAPRLSLAYQTGANSQLSMAYGHFYQTPDSEFLLINADWDFEKAEHYILNYQWTKDKQVFRAELYHKSYSSLVKFQDPDLSYDPELYGNAGDGYARGLDLFYRDQKLIKRADFWLSYSFLDSKRNYRDYPEEARPGFTSQHNLSVVYKHFIPKFSTQIGATYSFASGRPYDNPNLEGFNESKMDMYNDFSMNISYLTELGRHFTVFYFSASNVLGFKNSFGHRYSPNPDAQGIYAGEKILPMSKRFFFVGAFISFESKNNKK